MDRFEKPLDIRSFVSMYTDLVLLQIYYSPNSKPYSSSIIEREPSIIITKAAIVPVKKLILKKKNRVLEKMINKKSYLS